MERKKLELLVEFCYRRIICPVVEKRAKERVTDWTNAKRTFAQLIPTWRLTQLSLKESKQKIERECVEENYRNYMKGNTMESSRTEREGKTQNNQEGYSEPSWVEEHLSLLARLYQNYVVSCQIFK